MESQKIAKCRFCYGKRLSRVLEFGVFALSGVFPKSETQASTIGSLDLIMCEDCSLVQLERSYLPGDMYGENYGYRSGLNQSMVEHLKSIASYCEDKVQLKSGDTVLDIGSNDGTLLANYDQEGIVRIGIDPTAKKFIEFYSDGTIVRPTFFSKDAFESASPSPAKVITSIAMLYDLEDPRQFVSEVASCLDETGIWVSEQSYMPWMVISGAYDTVCHEHLEYYSLTSLKKIVESAGLRVVDVSINAANGGSLRTTFCHNESSQPTKESVKELIAWEESIGLSKPEFFSEFQNFVMNHGITLNKLVSDLVESGARVGALGASTKGSIVLQHAKLVKPLIERVGDVNPFKFGRFMPNSNVEIVSEETFLESPPDVVIILPWHFRSTFREKLRSFLTDGGKIIWPLPSIALESSKGTSIIMESPHNEEIDVDFLRHCTITGY